LTAITEPFEFSSPQDITVLGDVALFGYQGGLWVTNGTKAGTKELTAASSPEYLLPADLTGFGDKVLFISEGSSEDLFVSDGTSAGSYEFTWTGSDPRGFIALDNLALFQAVDPAGKQGLWATDGTSAGTHEISNPDAYFPGIFDIANFSGTVMGNEVVFAGENNLEEDALWITNGTTMSEVASLSAYDLAAVPPPPAPTDLALAPSSDSGVKGDDITNVTSSGTITVTGVSGVEELALASSAANTLTLQNANFAGVSGSSITVIGRNDGNTVNAAALTGANRVVAVGGAGKDVFTGGAGNDIFEFSAANLAAADRVAGGAGTNYLVMTTAGTVAAGGVSGVEVYELANGGADSLTLINANFTGVTGTSITVYGSDGGNTVSAAGVAAPDRIIVHAGIGADVLTGGAGSDVFFAGGDTKMTGAAGANEFVFNAAGSNTIADFTASATNEIEFISGSGFVLPGAAATPKALASLFVQGGTGTFTATTERFAYGTSNGDLYYSASGTTATEHLVAHLSGDPTLTASQLSHLLFAT
jgi:Ca2+-binding RTX toxin-like protein